MIVDRRNCAVGIKRFKSFRDVQAAFLDGEMRRWWAQAFGEVSA